MTDSDSLRGDPNHDPTRHLHPEIRELDTLRALLRPRAAATGDVSFPEALRGLIVELDGVTGQANLLHERVKVQDADLEAANNRVADLEIRLRREREQDHAGAQAVADRLRALMSTCFDGSHSGDIHVQLADMEKWIPKLTSEWKANHERWLLLCGTYGLAEPHRSLDDVLSHLARLAPMETIVGQQAIHTRLCELLCSIQGGHNGGTTQELFDELVGAVKEMGKNVLLERKLACAAAEGHDHCRELLVAACSTLGSADYDNLPHLVAGLLEQLNTSNGKAERLQDRVDEQDKARVLRAAETAVERKALEDRIAALVATPEGAENLHRSERAWAFTAKYADERVQAHIEHAKKRVAEAEAALALLGWDRAQDMTTWARSSAQPVAAARWSAICEAFGLDPEQDPPASIPAILAGDRWTNTRRMLADACANMRAPSLEVILGELIQTLSKVRGANKRVDQHTCTACTRRVHEGEKAVQGCSDCYWLEWGDAPTQAREESLATAKDRPARPSTARCPVCHRMAPVKLGGFEKHMSGDRVCAGTCSLLDLAKARSKALNVLGWSGADDPVEWAKEARRLADERIDVLQAELGVHAATIAETETQTEKLVAALNEKTAALDVADAHFSSLKRGHDEAHAALATLGWDGNSYPEDWAKTTAAHYKAVREALGVPAGKPIVAYAQHAAKGMQALAILGWQDGSPVEWATKRAAAEADLRGALAEAELVGNDHAAMVRQLWNNLRGTAAKLDDTARLCNEATSSHARAEKRLSTWRAWAAGFCPMGFDASASDDSIIAALVFVPVSAYNREISALQVELAHQRALVSVMVDIKRRLIALKDLSP